MIWVLLAVVGTVLGLLRMRARHRRTLAGLDSGRPTFTAAPPERSLLGLRDHRR